MAPPCGPCMLGRQLGMIVWTVAAVPKSQNIRYHNCQMPRMPQFLACDCVPGEYRCQLPRPIIALLREGYSLSACRRQLQALVDIAARRGHILRTSRKSYYERIKRQGVQIRGPHGFSASFSHSDAPLGRKARPLTYLSILGSVKSTQFYCSFISLDVMFGGQTNWLKTLRFGQTARG